MNGNFEYARALRSGWWLIASVLLITLAVTAFLTRRERPIYNSSALMVVAPVSSTTEPGDVVKSLETLERRTIIATFARIPSTDEMRRAVRDQLGLSREAARAYRIHGSVVPNTNILRVDVQGPEPDHAAHVANAVAQLTANEANLLYPLFELRSLEAATPARRPSFPDPKRNYLVGTAIGLLAGTAAALALQRLRTSRSDSAPERT